MDIRDDESEADYYAGRVNDRAYIGEAYNGATKDWSIVDVPPGTERVRMDGVGGGSEEITWQKFNGVRRSKFIPERERETIRESSSRAIQAPSREKDTLDIEISSSRRRKGGAVYEREYERIEETNNDRRVGMPRGPKNRVGTLWTEITKDLVVKEAIEELGYDYEETEYFYYIIRYLQYVRPALFLFITYFFLPRTFDLYAVFSFMTVINNPQGRRPPISPTLRNHPPRTATPDSRDRTGTQTHGTSRGMGACRGTKTWWRGLG